MNSKAKISDAINTCIENEEWEKARIILERELKKYSTDHWLLTSVGITYYEERKYRKAYKYMYNASKIAPNCPLVLWSMANALVQLDNNKDAIKILKLLIGRGLTQLAYGDCGEGVRWAKSLKNDCRYLLGLIYLNMANKRLGLKYIKEHLANRKPGLPSVYNLADVKGKLASLQKGK